MSDQPCTNSADCQGDVHLYCCPGPMAGMTDRAASALMDLMASDRDLRSPERQTWTRPAVLGTVGQVRAETQLHLEVDSEGRARVHEAVLAQLLVDAGWERTA